MPQPPRFCTSDRPAAWVMFVKLTGLRGALTTDVFTVDLTCLREVIASAPAAAPARKRRRLRILPQGLTFSGWPSFGPSCLRYGSGIWRGSTGGSGLGVRSFGLN